MLIHATPQQIYQIISTPIIPVLLLPVTGLLCLVFYHRMSSLHARFNLLRKEQRELEKISSGECLAHNQRTDLLLQKEIAAVQSRGHRIALSIFCFLLSIIFFSICAICVVCNLYWTYAIYLALFFWLCGPILICFGVCIAISELYSAMRSLQPLDMTTDLSMLR